MNKETTMRKDKFCCGTCAYNDDGFCDMLGKFVEDDDSPHCAYGRRWHQKGIEFQEE